MNKSDIKEASLDRPYKSQIIISQYTSLEDPEYDMGWECDVFLDGYYIGGGTAPTQPGAYDLANEIMYDYENPSLF